MRVIVAGSRTVLDPALVEAAITKSGFEATEVVSGGAAGADTLGEVWAIRKGIPVKRFPADWSTGRQAGIVRNQLMVDYAEALVAVWRGGSSGTADVIAKAQAKGIPTHVEVV